MDALTFPLPKQLYLVIAPHAARSQMYDLVATLALCGPVRIIDAGNQCNVYPIAQRIRRVTADLETVLKRIWLQRAFTCYQVAALLAEPALPQLPPASATLLFDLLSTFYDQDVKLPEATALLRDCLKHLQRMAEGAPVLVSTRPPPPACAERAQLLEMVREVAHTRWEVG
jgi:hypothetical protein